MLSRPLLLLLSVGCALTMLGCWQSDKIDFTLSIENQVIEPLVTDSLGVANSAPVYTIASNARFTLRDVSSGADGFTGRQWIVDGVRARKNPAVKKMYLFFNGLHTIELCLLDEVGEATCVSKVINVTGGMDRPAGEGSPLADGSDTLDLELGNDDSDMGDPLVDADGLSDSDGNESNVDMGGKLLATAETSANARDGSRNLNPAPSDTRGVTRGGSSGRSTSLPRYGNNRRSTTDNTNPPERTPKSTNNRRDDARRERVENEGNVTRNPSDPGAEARDGARAERTTSPGPGRTRTSDGNSKPRSVTTPPSGSNTTRSRSDKAPNAGRPDGSSVEPVEPKPQPEASAKPKLTVMDDPPPPPPPKPSVVTPKPAAELSRAETTGAPLRSFSTSCGTYVGGSATVRIAVREDIELRGFSMNTDGCGKVRITLAGDGRNESVTQKLAGGPRAISLSHLGWRLSADKAYTLTLTPLSDTDICNTNTTPALAHAGSCGGSERPSDQLALAYDGRQVIYDFRYYH